MQLLGYADLVLRTFYLCVEITNVTHISLTEKFYMLQMHLRSYTFVIKLPYDGSGELKRETHCCITLKC
jgi:hypothetical protein